MNRVIFKEQRTLQLDFRALPKDTRLLQNYPNPFNPETWIPYQLAEDLSVTIRIYTMDGQLVRTLKLDEQKAGQYMDKSKAAYWNGKNDCGEDVASGVYFYTLNVGSFEAIKKLVIVR
jgi:hypothetical protein